MAGVIAHSISIEKEAQTGNQDHDPLIVLPVNSLVDLSHAHISILCILIRSDRVCVACISPTCSWSKSRARSVLYRRA